MHALLFSYKKRTGLIGKLLARLGIIRPYSRTAYLSNNKLMKKKSKIKFIKDYKLVNKKTKIKKINKIKRFASFF